MGVEFRSNLLHKSGFQLHQIERIADFQEPIERLLRHKFTVRTPACRVAVGLEPWLVERSERVGVHVAQKRLVGRIGRRMLVTP